MSKLNEKGQGEECIAALGQLPLDRSVAFQIRGAHLAFTRLLEWRLSRHGVKLGHWYYLRALSLKNNVTQKNLSDATKVTETTSVLLLRNMADDGLIVRTKAKEDRRVTFVSLSPKGRELASEILPYATELNAIATVGISREEIDTCLSVLSRLTKNLEGSIRQSIDPGCEDAD